MTALTPLQDVHILRGLSAAQLEEVKAASQVMTCRRGQTVFEQGSDGREVYVVLAGEVAAFVDPAAQETVEAGCVDTGAVVRTVRAFLEERPPYRELAVTGAQPMDAEAERQLWRELERDFGCRHLDATPLDGGVRHRLRRGDEEKTFVRLVASTVLTWKDVSRPIRNGVDTVIGITGLPVVGARDLDEFFARESVSGPVDELVLVSGSSKDYEFRRGIDFLDTLLKLCSATSVATEELDAFAARYADEAHYVAGADVARIRDRVSIYKELRPDVGSIYHVVVDGRSKRLVLLADGLVVNFFSMHEKGVKTEYIDPIVTMQFLGLIKLSTSEIAPGVHKTDAHLRPEDMSTLWTAIDERCRPLPQRRRR